MTHPNGMQEYVVKNYEMQALAYYQEAVCYKEACTGKTESKMSDLGASLRLLGAILGPCWGQLGASWLDLGAMLGPSCDQFGSKLGLRRAVEAGLPA